MKTVGQDKIFRGDQFPILGGRLLKLSCTSLRLSAGGFPILGGRLLKAFSGRHTARLPTVSNPWREAIEVRKGAVGKMKEKNSFQSLEGGY